MIKLILSRSIIEREARGRKSVPPRINKIGQDGQGKVKRKVR